MTSYYTEFRFSTGQPVSAEFEEQLDVIAETLANNPDVDGDIGVDLRTGRIDLCITVNAADREAAVLAAFTAARTAIHAAGGHTTNWDGWLEKMLDSDEYGTSVTPSSLISSIS